MSRYTNTRRKVNKNNKSSYATTIYDKVPESNDDMYFISQHGDRCDSLANRFYGDSNFWWFIAKVNNIKSESTLQQAIERINKIVNNKKIREA